MSHVDLEVMRRTGTEGEKRCAEKIIPVVANQHYLLVTLLLCNAFAAEALPLVIDRLANPIVAIILSMSVLLIMGEIVPQAICKHHALSVGAASAPLCRFLMFVTAPVSWPIAKLLDLMLGEGHAAMFRRSQLEEFVDMHGAEEGMGGELTETEISIIKGALAFSGKVAQEAMTPINKVFMLSSNTILSQGTFNKILATGHSRVPVYRGEDRNDIMGIILVKELVGINPADNVPITHVTLRSLPAVSIETPMYDMLDLFETGRSHMALLMTGMPLHTTENIGTEPGMTSSASQAMLVAQPSGLPPQRRPTNRIDEAVPLGQTRSRKNIFVTEPPSKTSRPNILSAWATSEPPVNEDVAVINEAVEEVPAVPVAAGVLTIEDCIEELIQNEIVDETDRYVDNIQSERVTAARLVSKLPVKMRADFLKHFTPRHTTSSAHTVLQAEGHGAPHRPFPAVSAHASHSTPSLTSGGGGAGVGDSGQRLTQPLLENSRLAS
mmetsp:Transcript_6117/g.15783  ORF Transcript_6117/g.15783 Transcript_6117/m.15783 type:complete len:495 (-) Transcript_6117:32-1516(-)